MGRKSNDLHLQQAPILDHFRHVMIDRKSLFVPMPEWYNNSAGGFNPFHLPGLINDESLQILLNVMQNSLSEPRV